MSATTRRKLVVIGNGMAGDRVVEEIVRRDATGFAICVLGAEKHASYNRILLSDVLSGAKREEDVAARPASWYAEHAIRLRTGVKVTRIDRKRRVVIAHPTRPGASPYDADGEDQQAPPVEEPYDQVIIATGSRPFLPKVEGFGIDGTFLFRTLEDCARIRAHARLCRSATVIGGGLLGLEAARGLLARGLELTVIEAARQLMPAQLDPEAGAVLRDAIEAMGIGVLLDTTATHVLGGERVAALRLADGRTLATDMVVLSVGIRPIVEVARSSGLRVERAVACDDQMRTSDPDVFALGECAEHRGTVYGLVDPIWEQAATLADVITGSNPAAAYRGSRVATRLKVMGVELVAMGEVGATQPDDEVVVYREPSRGVYKKMVVRDGVLSAAILLGEADTAGVLTQMFLLGTPLPDRRADLLFGTSSGAPILSVLDLPEHVQICNCHGVSKGQIKEAIQVGKCRSLTRLGASTKAGSGCGGCKPFLRQFLEIYAGGVEEGDPSEHYYVPGVPLPKPELIAAVKDRALRSVSAVFRELADGKEDPVSKPGLASLLRSIWDADYEDERDARFVNDRVHANIQRDGTFSVVPRVYGGVTTPAELRRIADVAEQYEVRLVKLTGGQRIDLLGVRKEDLPHVWRDLGMPSGHAYTKAFRTCKSCVGTEFCRYGLGDSIELAQRIERRFQGIEAPHKMKLATAGCPRNCSEAYVKDLGAVAIEGGRWEVYVGGAAGSTVRKGDLLCAVETHEEVIRTMGRFIQHYRENAKYMERSYGFVERTGIERLRELLVEDREGICARLDREIDAAVAAYRDPWAAEAAAPVHEAQFAAPVSVADDREDLRP